MRGLFEVDVTEPRRRIRELEAETGERLSFTAFLTACLARALDEDERVRAFRDWLGRLVIFDDVNVAVMVEVGGERPYVAVRLIQAANRKTVRQIHDEIRAFQRGSGDRREARRLELITRVPGPVRRGVLRFISRTPRLSHRIRGTAFLTAVGMFTGGGGWGIGGGSVYTVGVTVGGIAEKPLVVDGQIRAREVLHVTLDVDHDVVDGAPAARFGRRFKELVESGYGLVEAPT
jgi:pyruvate/2-oxoglutarate dehydrogenase complex dihydrolipoamide acyltransferase (E2) component